ITGITPSFAQAGATVQILGTGFLSFGVTRACVGTTCTNSVQVLDDNHVAFAVTSTMQTGQVAVSGALGNATSGYVLTIGTAQLAPTISGFTPSSGPTGTAVTITGTHFTGATGLSFNGTQASSFVVVSDTTATATVPPGATSGPIAI